MMLSNGSLTLAKAIRVADLRAYLLSRHWKIQPFKRSEVIRFEGPPDDHGNPLTLLIPASEQLRDYPLRIEEIVDTLSTLEQRPAAEIVRNIITPTSDILHLRLDSPTTRTGTLELGFVEQYFASVRNLLVFAACGEMRPKPFYARAFKQAVQIADRCRFRPAPAASFGVDVEAPVVPPINDAQVQLKAYPVERLVLLSLMRALGELQSSIEAGQPGRVTTSATARISANLCEAILGMKPDANEVRWEAHVSWSAAWPMDDPPPGLVAFEGRAFEQIDSISRALRSGNEPSRRILHGRVVRMAAEDPVHGDAGPLVVTLDVESANAPAHVDVAMTAEQYRQACNAHLDGRRIAVKGVLDRIGRKWHLLDVSDFQVLNGAAP